MGMIERSLARLFSVGKALERPPMGGGGMFAGSFGIGTSLAAGPAPFRSAVASVGSVGWLFAVVERIASSIAAVPWHLYRINAKGEKEEIASHPLLTLWRKVNPYYTWEEFVETFQQHLELTGKAFWLVLPLDGGQPQELWPLRPDAVRVVPDPEKFISAYLYQVGGQTFTLRPEQVIYLRYPNPGNPYEGMSPVQAAMTDIDAERYAALWTLNFFLNSAEPGGIIQTKALTDEEFERLRLRWQESHKGVANAHRVAILEEATWVDRKLTQRDMQFEQLRRLNRDTILGAFGVHSSVMGVSESVNRANALAARLDFAQWVLLPRLRRIRAKLNEELCPRFGADLEFDFENPGPMDPEMILREAIEGYKAGLLTRNEGRVRLGEDAVEDGDNFFTPPAALFGLDSPQVTTKGPEPFSALPHRLALALSASDTELYPGPVAEVFAAIRRAWGTRLEEERERLVAFLKEATKSLQKQLPPDASAYDWDWWERYGEVVIAELTTLFVVSLKAGMAPGVLIDVPEHELQRRAGVYARTRGGRLLRLGEDGNLVNATRARVNALVAETLERGESLGQLVAKLREDPVLSRAWARTVARTETATALGTADQDLAQVAGLDEKRWITRGADVAEAICLANEAQGWKGIADPFQSGHLHPPAHPNCGCVASYRGASFHRQRAVVAEIRCPTCRKLCAKGLHAGEPVYCPRCKTEFVVAL